MDDFAFLMPLIGFWAMKALIAIVRWATTPIRPYPWRSAGL